MRHRSQPNDSFVACVAHSSPFQNVASQLHRLALAHPSCDATLYMVIAHVRMDVCIDCSLARAAADRLPTTGAGGALEAAMPLEAASSARAASWAGLSSTVLDRLPASSTSAAALITVARNSSAEDASEAAYASCSAAAAALTWLRVACAPPALPGSVCAGTDAASEAAADK